MCWRRFDGGGQLDRVRWTVGQLESWTGKAFEILECLTPDKLIPDHLNTDS